MNWIRYLTVMSLYSHFAGSDMELDLLAAAETESDSESNHSNQDNASGRRSVVTAATAGSEAGWSTAHISGVCFEAFDILPFDFDLT